VLELRNIQLNYQRPCTVTCELCARSAW